MFLRVLAACSLGLCLGSVFGCRGDDDGDQPEAPDASVDYPGLDASSLPASSVPYDGGVQAIPPQFVPPDAPDAIPAHGDAAVQPDTAVDIEDPPVARDCLELEAGETVTFEAQLTGELIWRRVEAAPICPATRVSAYEVAYELYTLCPSDSPRVLEIVMLGADRLEMAPRESVADPMLVVYPEERSLDEDPFACLALNDDGSFDGLTSNSARIERFEVAEGESPVIVATSRERPDQRGLGLFELTLRAE